MLTLGADVFVARLFVSDDSRGIRAHNRVIKPNGSLAEAVVILWLSERQRKMVSRRHFRFVVNLTTNLENELENELECQRTTLESGVFLNTKVSRGQHLFTVVIYSSYLVTKLVK